MGKKQERRFTREQEIEIGEEYVEGGVTMRELAAKYDVALSTMSGIIHRSGVIDELERRADSRSRLSLVRLKMASANASAKLVRLAEKERDDSMVYADIQLLQQILDRAGVRATKNEDNSITLKFADGAGFNLGNTEEAEIVKE